MTTLNGATNTPPEGVRVANSGEFAAMWNTATLAQREEYVRRMGESNDLALACVVKDHEGLLHELESLRINHHKLTTQLEVMLTDEVYDGGFGVMSERQLREHIRNLAVKCDEVVREHKA